jgi:hypothetical protein
MEDLKFCVSQIKVGEVENGRQREVVEPSIYTEIWVDTCGALNLNGNDKFGVPDYMSSSKRLSGKDWVKYILGRGMYQPSRAICNMLVPMFQQPGRMAPSQLVKVIVNVPRNLDLEKRLS